MYSFDNYAVRLYAVRAIYAVYAVQFLQFDFEEPYAVYAILKSHKTDSVVLYCVMQFLRPMQ